MSSKFIVFSNGMVVHEDNKPMIKPSFRLVETPSLVWPENSQQKPPFAIQVSRLVEYHFNLFLDGEDQGKIEAGSISLPEIMESFPDSFAFSDLSKDKRKDLDEALGKILRYQNRLESTPFSVVSQQPVVVEGAEPAEPSPQDISKAKIEKYKGKAQAIVGRMARKETFEKMEDLLKVIRKEENDLQAITTAFNVQEAIVEVAASIMEPKADGKKYPKAKKAA